VALAGVGLWQVHQRTCHPLYSSTWGIPPVSVGDRHDRIQERSITLLERPLSRSPWAKAFVYSSRCIVPSRSASTTDARCSANPGLALSASCSTPMPLRVRPCDPRPRSAPGGWSFADLESEDDVASAPVGEEMSGRTGARPLQVHLPCATPTAWCLCAKMGYLANWVNTWRDRLYSIYTLQRDWRTVFWRALYYSLLKLA
jgi:hypothetical protein